MKNTKTKEPKMIEFIDLASHELKAPITTIKAYTQMVRKNLSQSNGDKNAFMLEKIENQVDKMNRIINSLLDISRIEGGRFSFEKKSIDLNEVVNKAISDFQNTNSTPIIVKGGEITKNVFANPERIKMVVLNILNNAANFSHPEDAVLVSLKEVEDKAQVSIENHGPMIPKDRALFVFQKFSTLGKNSGGLGVSMFISKEVIDRHDGKIWFETIPAHRDQTSSTIFYFTLPFAS